MNCVYKPCPTRMQLAGWRTQISNNVLLNYLLRRKHAPWEVIAEVFYSSYSSSKDVLALFRHFQDRYCYSNSDVMCHMTKYCNVIGLHCTVRQDMACIHSSPDPSLLAEVGLACETTPYNVKYTKLWIDFSWFKWILGDLDTTYKLCMAGVCLRSEHKLHFVPCWLIH